MFDNLRSAFREAVDNFRSEVSRDAVPEAADRLIRAMKAELVDARARLDRLEEELAATRSALSSEVEALETCLRREQMAHRIGDGETEEVARTFARRHLRRRDLLEEKAEVQARELSEARSELADMEARFSRARARREDMVARAGRTDAHTRLGEAEALFGDLDRMAERIDDFGRRVAADQEVDAAVDGGGASDAGPASPRADDVDVRLAELKRRMGASDP